MKNDLIWGWVFVGLALLMVACIIYGGFIGNWAAIPMCCFALTLNITNAISRLRAYKYHKDSMRFQQSLRDFKDAFNACWPDKDDDDPEDNYIITD